MLPYPNLTAEIAKRGIKKKVIAESIGVSTRTLRNRLNGSIPFSWPEVSTIIQRFFPDLKPDYLFAKQETKKVSRVLTTPKSDRRS